MRIRDVRASVHRLPIYLPGFEAPTEHRHHVFCAQLTASVVAAIQ